MPRDGEPIRLNGALHVLSTILKCVTASAAEAKLGALFLNMKEGRTLQLALEELGHPQPPTPVMTDNTTALGFVTRNLQPKQTKSTDMRYWWMRDRSDQKQFHYYWGSGKKIRADYFTKHHCAAHHREMRPTYLTPSDEVNKFRIQMGMSPLVF